MDIGLMSRKLLNTVVQKYLNISGKLKKIININASDGK